jgi:hypothetical protein
MVIYDGYFTVCRTMKLIYFFGQTGLSTQEIQQAFWRGKI